MLQSLGCNGFGSGKERSMKLLNRDQHAPMYIFLEIGGGRVNERREMETTK